MSLMGKGINFTTIQHFDINRRVISHATTKAWTQVPHCAYVYDADVTDFINFYNTHTEALNAKGKVTINTIMMKIISEALKAAPELNSHLLYHPIRKAGCQMITPDINIAIPWLLKDGRMITPVVKHVEQKNLHEITNYITDLRRRIENTDIDAMQYTVGFEETVSELKHFHFKVVRQILSTKIGKGRLRKPTRADKKAYRAVPKEDKITSDDIFGGSVLISNFGSMFKTQKGAVTMLEIITPQVLVLGLNNVQERPAVITNEKGEKEIAIRKIMPITITWDHRAADTANIVPFQAAIDNFLNNPELILEWT